MEDFGQKLGQCCLNGSVIYLFGTLGMGKTTLSRAIVHGFGWEGRVKSPTYNLLEHYELAQVEVIHFDLYRLADPEELEFLGVRDFDVEGTIWLIEWPEKGLGVLPKADLELTLHEAGDARTIELVAQTEKGRMQLESLRMSMGLNA